MSVQERQNAFQEQIRKKMEEEKRKEAESQQSKDAPAAAPAAESTPAAETPASKPAAETEVKAAVAETEKAAAVAASDKEGEKDAAAAVAAVKTDEAEKKPEEKPEEKRAEEKPEEKEETEDERMEREIAEMEALEKEEEEREKAYNAKKKAEKEAADKIKAAKLDEDLKRQEREAEELEAKRERERNGESENKDDDSEAKALFASLKKPTLGPGAEAETPAPAEPTPVANAAQAAQKPKPAHLKLETNKRVEPAEPTPGMQALKSSRFLEIKEDLKYPEGVKSPNPALTQKGRAYDQDFLLQFQSVFKEKPTVDWTRRSRTLSAVAMSQVQPVLALPVVAALPWALGQLLDVVAPAPDLEAVRWAASAVVPALFLQAPLPSSALLQPTQVPALPVLWVPVCPATLAWVALAAWVLVLTLPWVPTHPVSPAAVVDVAQASATTAHPAREKWMMPLTRCLSLLVWISSPLRSPPTVGSLAVWLLVLPTLPTPNSVVTWLPTWCSAR